MKKILSNCSFLRSDTGEVVKPNQEVKGDESYLADLVRVGNAREVAVAPPRSKKRAKKSDELPDG